MFLNLRHSSFKTKGRLVRMVDNNGGKFERLKKIAFYPNRIFLSQKFIGWYIKNRIGKLKFWRYGHSKGLISNCLLKVIRWARLVQNETEEEIILALSLTCFGLILRITFLIHLCSQTGHCSFQNGQCGLKSDRNATFHWTVGSGQTPTEKTGPSYDHSSFSKDGKSRRKLKVG